MAEWRFKMKLIYLLLILICITFISCDFFSTRTPEPPDTGRSGFLPPTSATIVLTNFINSIKEKNSENFIACLSDSSTSNLTFSFIPSSEALVKFPGKFNIWNRTSELRSFNSVLSSIKDDEKPNLIFKKSLNDFENFSTDSAVFYSSYYLFIPHTKENLPTEYEGTIQLTINLHNQRWSITKWIDISSMEDSSKFSWSILKANFSD